MNSLRSLLFCPATEPDKVMKIPSKGADATAIDLEDSVSDSLKVSARGIAHATLESPEFEANHVYVRINGFRTGLAEEDIRQVVHRNLNGIVIPKAETSEQIRVASDILSQAESSNGWEPGSIRIIALIETGLGVHNAAGILGADARVLTGIFGFVDYMLDLGMNAIDHSNDAQELLFARSAVVNAAAAAGVSPPLDGPFVGIEKSDEFFSQCRQARTLGFQGKMLIHPNQVPLAHDAFRPSLDEVEQASRIVADFEAATSQGVASIVVDGRLVDYPVFFRARRILEDGKR